MKDISTILAENSLSKNLDERFFFLNQRKVKFQSQNTEDYNQPFLMTEHQDSLTKAKGTTTEPDEIHYQLLKHLLEKSLQYLLQIYNIWVKGNVPICWEKAIIISIPKNQNDSTNPINYQLIVLISCISKTFERIIHTRLTW